MPDAGGALESQQGIAARIPYENIDVNQRGIGLAMSAFFHAAEISRKRQQLEQALMIADRKAKDTEQKHYMDMANFQVNAALKEQAMNLRAQGLENTASAASQRLELMSMMDNWKINKKQELDASVVNMTGAISGMKSKPGDPDYWANLTDIASKNPSAAESPLGRQLLKQYKEDHNAAVRHAYDANNAAWKALSYNVKREIWGGHQEDLSPVINLDMWKRETDAKGKETGNYTLDLGPKDPVNNPTGPHSYTRLPAQRLHDLAKQYDELTKQRGSIPSQINDRDVTATPTSSSTPTMSEKDIRAIHYARTHPGDPDSAKILQTLGVQ